MNITIWGVSPNNPTSIDEITIGYKIDESESKFEINIDSICEDLKNILNSYKKELIKTIINEGE